MTGDQPAAHQVGEKTPSLLQTGEHDLCPGCGEPVALRILLETITELGLSTSTIGVVGIGCYTAFSRTLDVDLVQALHGRAPSVATGVKRMQPDKAVFTLQGDGDMVDEGLQEVLHTAARADDDPPPVRQGPLPVYPAPLAQETQSTYVPQSVALSGPEEISDWDSSRTRFRRR